MEGAGGRETGGGGGGGRKEGRDAGGADMSGIHCLSVHRGH